MRLVVDGYRGRIGFDGELMADEAWRHTVSVSIERQPQVLVNESLGAVAIVRSEER